MGLEPDPDDSLIAAAEAAASWARARRAKWTNVPLSVPDPASATPAADFEFEFEPQPPAPTPPPRAVPPPVAPPPVLSPPPSFTSPAQVFPEFEFPEPVSPPPVPATSAPSEAATLAARARLGEAVRGLGAPLRRWLPHIAAAAALGVVVVAAVRYVPSVLSTFSEKKTAVAPPRAKPAAPPAAARKATGTLQINSTPTGAQVTVDGRPRGVTPLQLNDLSPGHHDVVLKSDAGTVRRAVTVTANTVVAIEEAIFSGWVAVYSPIEVEIAENGRVLRPDERSQVMLPPGVHDLRFANKPLGYDVVRQVEVKPGEATTIRLTPEPSRLTVTTTEPAEVWLDGMRIGDAPLAAVSVPLGTHELVVRRTAGGERRYTITIGVAPFTMHVDFSQPGA